MYYYIELNWLLNQDNDWYNKTIMNECFYSGNAIKKGGKIFHVSTNMFLNIKQQFQGFKFFAWLVPYRVK